MNGSWKRRTRSDAVVPGVGRGSCCQAKESDSAMNASSGWFEKELLETFYLIVEEYRTGRIDESLFFDKIFQISERYGRFAGKEEVSRNQMSLFSS
jgi:hypothetical protein